ncbi:WHG domain-containing protein [Streptomyces sp. NPDC005408]|uniref:WHG domain-containing protein n=1 Tax=Streptomyces sp. NPDC005408 TaxID=3155341 RepID=UPI0033B9C205
MSSAATHAIWPDGWAGSWPERSSAPQGKPSEGESHEQRSADRSGRNQARAAASRAHRSEFAFIRGPMAPGAQDAAGQAASGQQALGRQAGWVLGRIFAELIADLWQIRPFPVPEPGSLPPGLTRQLSGIRGGPTADLPVEAIAVMLRWWVRLYGLICMEVMGHMESAMTDGTAFFEGELADACGALGIRKFYMAP